MTYHSSNAVVTQSLDESDCIAHPVDQGVGHQVVVVSDDITATATVATQVWCYDVVTGLDQEGDLLAPTESALREPVK
jgi:hypothetical protein